VRCTPSAAGAGARGREKGGIAKRQVAGWMRATCCNNLLQHCSQLVAPSIPTQVQQVLVEMQARHKTDPITTKVKVASPAAACCHLAFALPSHARTPRTRHCGQRRLCSSDCATQCVWNTCPHSRSAHHSSVLVSEERQMTHWMPTMAASENASVGWAGGALQPCLSPAGAACRYLLLQRAGPSAGEPAGLAVRVGLLIALANSWEGKLALCSLKLRVPLAAPSSGTPRAVLSACATLWSPVMTTQWLLRAQTTCNLLRFWGAC